MKRDFWAKGQFVPKIKCILMCLCLFPPLHVSVLFSNTVINLS